MMKNLPVMRETWVQSLGSGMSPAEGIGNPLQYLFLESSMQSGGLQSMCCKEDMT